MKPISSYSHTEAYFYSMLEKFNVRVYGLIVESNKVIISKERYGQHRITKFLGGGIELGEGVIDALKREFKEELDTEILEYELFHITEQFIQSAFNETEQVVAIYYRVKTSAFEIEKCEHDLFWTEADCNLLNEIDFTFAQDKMIFEKLCKQI